MDLYNYRASVERVVDGDTVILRVELGFHATVVLRFRLAGIDAPERYDVEGDVAKEWLIKALYTAEQLGLLWISTEKDLRGDDKKGKWGRYLVWLWPADPAGYSLDERSFGSTINWAMVEEGLAVPYPA